MTNSSQSAKTYVEKLLADRVSKLESGAVGADLTRLPTIKEVASDLDVRDYVVRGIYQELTAAGRIVTTRGRGSFLIPPERIAKKSFRFGIDVDMDHVDPLKVWRSKIYDAVLSSTLHSSASVVLRGFNLKGGNVDLSEFDGIIVFSVSEHDRELRDFEDRLADEGMPWVSVNPPRFTSTANFISTDFFHLGKRVGEAFLASGRKRIVLISDHDLDDSVSEKLRFHGLVDGIGLGRRNGEKVTMLKAKSVAMQDAQPALESYIEKNGVPDAVYAASDYLALGSARYLAQRGETIGKGISIIGGTGADLSFSEFPELTRTVQPYRELGAAAIEMLLKQNAEKSAIPGRYLSASFIGGATTTAKESRILGI